MWAHTGDAPTPPLLTTGSQKEPFSLKRRLLLLPVASATGNGFRQLTTLSEGGTWDEVGFESICCLFLKKPAQNGQKRTEEEEILVWSHFGTNSPNLKYLYAYKHLGQKQEYTGGGQKQGRRRRDNKRCFPQTSGLEVTKAPFCTLSYCG